MTPNSKTESINLETKNIQVSFIKLLRIQKSAKDITSQGFKLANYSNLQYY